MTARTELLAAADELERTGALTIGNASPAVLAVIDPIARAGRGTREAAVALRAAAGGDWDMPKIRAVLADDEREIAATQAVVERLEQVLDDERRHLTHLERRLADKREAWTRHTGVTL